MPVSLDPQPLNPCTLPGPSTPIPVPFQPMGDEAEIARAVDSRSLYARPFPVDTTIDAITEFFAKVGGSVALGIEGRSSSPRWAAVQCRAAARVGSCLGQGGKGRQCGAAARSSETVWRPSAAAVAV